jgi:MerR family transcriptional regulator, light-induced transcriptional regulator
MDIGPRPTDRVALVHELREAFTAALLLGDVVKAEIAVREGIDADLDEAILQNEVLAPSLRRVGDLWEDGSLTVADEHLATQITLRVLALEREAARVARGRRDDRVMLAAIEGEEHYVGLQMVSNLLASAGYEARFLGADVPIDSLAPIVEKHQPRVFALTATMPESGELLPLAVDEVRSGGGTVGVIVGGQGVPEGFRETEGLVVPRNVSDVVEAVDALVRRPELN